MASLHTSSRPLSAGDYITRCWPLFALLLVTLLFYAHRNMSMLSSLPPPSPSQTAPLPYPLTIALVHYATSKVTPQQTKQEIMITANILSRRGPCNFLVFGLGFDSALWQALNYGGRTVFLEEDPAWITQMKQTHPTLEAYAVNYTTTLSEADDLLAYARENREICAPAGKSSSSLMESECRLVLRTLPAMVYGIRWEVIMIDAPRGYDAGFPGRMTAIFTSSLMARGKAREESTDILLHDVERPVEKKYSTEFFCGKNLVEEEGKLWHFQLFGDGASSSSSKDFCVS